MKTPTKGLTPDKAKRRPGATPPSPVKSYASKPVPKKFTPRKQGK